MIIDRDLVATRGCFAKEHKIIRILILDEKIIGIASLMKKSVLKNQKLIETERPGKIIN